MDNSSQWPQGFGVVKGLDHPSSSGSIDQQKRTLARPQKDQIVNCPRCNSVNTKFCYYNNYSLSQPRYFCKTCRRYWTAGGSLRNVPVGGGSRKNRRSSSSSSATSVLTAAQAQAQALANLSSSSSLHQGHDLNLSFPPHAKTHDDLHRHHQYPNTKPTFSTKHNFSIDQLSSSKLLAHLPNPNSTDMPPLLPPMGLFKNSLRNEAREMMMNPPDHQHAFSSIGFPQDQYKPSSLNFSLDGFTGDDGYASSLQLGVQQNSDAGARLLFPNFNQENLNKEAASSDVQFDHPHNRSSVQNGDGSSAAGFWTGMLSGGSW